MNFLLELKTRNELLFWFGTINLVAALVFAVLTRMSTMEVVGANAWLKPLKFAVSIGTYSWTMAWFVYELKSASLTQWFSWSIVLLLGFEIVYIALMAGRGQASHFNVSTPATAMLYGMMGTAASLVAVWTAVIALRYFQLDFPDLPASYLMAIRWGMVLFVIFAFEGFVMGSRLSHTIGGPDGGTGLPITGWSTQYGDPRIPHFVGMHALQVLPLLGFFLIRDVRWMAMAIVVYGALAVWTLWLAFQGRPLIPMN